ncbi:hypothetical protein ABXT68_02020 [Candidatus Pelagibacter sp. Uisw_116]|uniref:hypothetical protein n=1 Tax=Candidatus Pelagibacter sp. Uisw_116 TaxID=3230986 RepID=UPI0039EC2856
MKDKKTHLFILIIIPFIYLFPHTLRLIEMGNDFELLYFAYKKYIFEFIQIGHLPLWSPSEAGGYSLIFNPFAQYFYPLSWILYFFSFIIGDLSKYTYLIYTILGVSIYNVGQYLWLRRLGLDIKYCFFATLITCFGLKINEILRFPNAIHTFAWFSWILYGMTLSIKVENNIKSSLILFVSTILILTAGYPYYIFYGFLLFGSYFIFISFYGVKKEIYKNDTIHNNLYLFFYNVLPPLLALLIVLPWFEGIKEVMEITRDRNIQDISFSYTAGSNFIDQLGSWIFPPISLAEGWYYFGTLMTVLFIFYVINFLLSKNKQLLEKYFLTFFFIFFLFNYQFSAVENSYLFKIIWEKFDLLKNFRSFSRINILLIPLFAVLFCFILKSIEEKKHNINFLITTCIVAIFIILLQIYIIEVSDIKNHYWKTWQERRLLYGSIKFSSIAFIFDLYNHYIYSISLIISLIIFNFFKIRKSKKLLPHLIVILVAGELFLLSNIQWAIPYKFYDFNNYNLLSKKPLDDINDAFFNPRVLTEVKGNTYFRNFRKFNINYFDNFGLDKHTKLVDKYFKRNGNLKDGLNQVTIKKINQFWGLKDNNKVFFTKKIDHQTIEKFINDVNFLRNNKDVFISMEISNYNGDEIYIDLKTNTAGFLTFVDNWSPGWKVYVNNKEKSIVKLLETYKSVKINTGYNKIKFKYEPW